MLQDQQPIDDGLGWPVYEVDGGSDLLLRVRAVEAAISFLREKTATLPQFHETYSKIYQFYKNEHDKKLD